MMIDSNSDVYVIGPNKYHAGSIIGGSKNDYKPRSNWTKVENLSGLSIKVQCGDMGYMAILTTDGVFTAGLSLDLMI